MANAIVEQTRPVAVAAECLGQGGVTLFRVWCSGMEIWLYQGDGGQWCPIWPCRRVDLAPIAAVVAAAFPALVHGSMQGAGR